MTDSNRFVHDGTEEQHAHTETQTPLVEPANIRLIYESADRRFCLFEDANGHLTSVRTSKLA